MSYWASPMVAAKRAVTAPIRATDKPAHRSQGEEDRGPRHHVDTRRDHGGGVDEGRYRRGPGHGVGEPDVQGDLGALPGGTQQEEEGDGRDQPAAVDQGIRGGMEDLDEVQGAESGKVPKPAKRMNMATRKPRSPIRLTMKAFFPESAFSLSREPVPDEDVGTEPHPLPTHEHEEEAGPHDQGQHEEDEEVQVGEVPGITLVVPHVAHAEDVDQEAHPRHHHHHDHAELVELEGHIHLEGPRVHPGPVVPDDGLVEFGPQHPGEVHQDDEEGQTHARRARSRWAAYG